MGSRPSAGGPVPVPPVGPGNKDSLGPGVALRGPAGQGGGQDGSSRERPSAAWGTLGHGQSQSCAVAPVAGEVVIKSLTYGEWCPLAPASQGLLSGPPARLHPEWLSASLMLSSRLCAWEGSGSEMFFAAGSSLTPAQGLP